VAITSKGGGIVRRRKSTETLDELLENQGAEVCPEESTAENNQGRSGRPAALSQPDLLHRRDKLQGMFQAHWPTIGWNLRLARSRMDIAQALRPLADFKLPTIDLLLLETPSKPVQDGIHTFRREHKRLNAECSESYARLESCRSFFLEARDAYSQARVRLDAARDRYVFALKEKKPTSSYLEELKQLPILCNKLRVEVKQREESAKRCTEEFRRIQIEIRALEAHFAQTELLRFLRSRKYAFTPENVSKAAAGLPALGCRRSFLLCSRVRYASVPSINYVIFEAVSKILNKQNPRSAEEAVREMRRQISTRRQFATVKAYLSEHWHALEHAAHKVWNSPAHPKSRAFQITSLFLQTLKAPKRVVNPLLDALEKDLSNA
jgi:hypothetical protein